MTRVTFLRIGGTWTVSGAPGSGPVAAFTATAGNGTVWLFDASGSASGRGSISSYQWNFGDGTTGSGVSVSHSFTAGTFAVTLTVTDSSGASAQSSTTISPDGFVLGTTQPDSSSVGAGIVRAYPTGSGSTLNGNQTVTGANVLRNATVNGDVTLSGTAQLLDCVVHGRVLCNGSGNVVENNLVDFITGSDYGASAGATGGDVWGIFCTSATGQAQVRFNTIRGRVTSYKINGIGARNFYAYRNDISGVVDGMSVYCASSTSTTVNTKIEGNYIHDLQYYSPDPNHAANATEPSSTHNDGIQFQGNTDLVSVKGNMIDGNWSSQVGTNVTNKSQFQIPTWHQLSAIMLTPNVSPSCVINFDSNWFADGVYTVNGGAASSGNFTFSNNRFGAGYTGRHWVINPSATLVQSGNVDQSGSPITAFRST